MLQVGFDASKENCADLRNSKVVDIIHELRSYGIEVFVHDPEADPDEAMDEYGVRLMGWDELPRADAVVVAAVAAVAHRSLRTLGADDLARKLVKGGCVIDVKSAFDPSALAAAGLRVWRL
jgi:UDP-N-acetyl-D-glucosamine/UDP-N-acetyl-D-galactosamine dehydrogenase